MLVADQTVGLAWPDTDAHARWYEIDTTSTPELIQQGTIAPGPGISTYTPAIAIGAGGVIGLTYNESSSTEYASVYDTGRTAGDPAGMMQSPVVALCRRRDVPERVLLMGELLGDLGRSLEPRHLLD